jgi:hypothetical protein
MISALFRFAAILAACLAMQASAADVGRVLLAAGDTVAVRGSQTIKLTFGTAIQDKDVLRTGPASNLQVRFIDESIVSMRESSELRIDDFRFSGKEDGSERAFLSLLKGGLRTVTGIIGRANHKTYQMSTTTATIGIRGTDYSATLCQGDCRNNDGSLAKDGLYGRTHGASFGTNRIDVTNPVDSKVFGINENFFVSDAKSPVQPLLVSPDFVSNRLESRKQGGTKSATGASGNEQASASSGVEAESRLATPPPAETPQKLEFVATESLGSTGSPAVVSGGITIVGLGVYNSIFLGDPADGGGFFAVSNLITDPSGAAADLAAAQKLIGFTLPRDNIIMPSSGDVDVSATAGTVIDETVVNSLNAHWGRWTSGTFTDGNGPQTLNLNNQFHYLYGPVTSPETVAAKTGTFNLLMVQGTTPTNNLGQTGSFSMSPSSVNFTARTVTFGSAGFSFPSQSWSFSGGAVPIQFVAGKGAIVDQVTSGLCSGAGCGGSSSAVLGKTGAFMGTRGDHLGVSFNAVTTTGPLSNAQTVKILSCASSGC